jgi:hypothetical protein
MRNILRIGWVALVLAVGVTAAVPANAQSSAELANICRALMIKAHPVELYGSSGSAAAQRAYFQECISRQGNMPEAEHGDRAGSPQSTTTGQGK